jgi:hypothetical protein
MDGTFQIHGIAILTPTSYPGAAAVIKGWVEWLTSDNPPSAAAAVVQRFVER